MGKPVIVDIISPLLIQVKIQIYLIGVDSTIVLCIYLQSRSRCLLLGANGIQKYGVKNSIDLLRRSIPLNKQHICWFTFVKINSPNTSKSMSLFQDRT